MFVLLTHGFKRRDFKVHPLTKEELLQEHITNGVVMPSDLDLNMHMNNSKYLREFDFGRIGLYLNKGLREVLLQLNGIILVNAVNVRYRRSLLLFQFYQVRTKIIWWEERSMYLEQRMVTSDGFVVAIALVKMAVRGTTTSDIMSAVCGNVKVTSPLPTNELKAWQESINLSSKRLKDETSSIGFKTPQNVNSSSSVRQRNQTLR
jgi:acyl-CoA thioesterase FadM